MLHLYWSYSIFTYSIPDFYAPACGYVFIQLFVSSYFYTSLENKKLFGDSQSRKTIVSNWTEIVNLWGLSWLLADRCFWQVMCRRVLALFQTCIQILPIFWIWGGGPEQAHGLVSSPRSGFKPMAWLQAHTEWVSTWAKLASCRRIEVWPLDLKTGLRLEPRKWHLTLQAPRWSDHHCNSTMFMYLIKPSVTGKRYHILWDSVTLCV